MARRRSLIATTAIFAALAGSAGAAAPSSTVNIRCDLVGMQGVHARSSWEFRIVEDTITELSYTKNGVPPAHYVPGLWSSGGTIGDRVVFEAGNGWAMFVPIQPGGEAFLFHNSKAVAAGVCSPSSLHKPPPPVNNDGLPPGMSRTPPASIQLEADGDHNLFAPVIIGGHSVRMAVDSGATRSIIQPELADRLISESEAVEVEPETYTLANGEEHDQRVLLVKRMSVAGHSLSNQIVSVNKVSLLGVSQLRALNALVDFHSEALIFGRSP